MRSWKRSATKRRDGLASHSGATGATGGIGATGGTGATGSIGGRDIRSHFKTAFFCHRERLERSRYLKNLDFMLRSE